MVLLGSSIPPLKAPGSTFGEGRQASHQLSDTRTPILINFGIQYPEEETRERKICPPDIQTVYLRSEAKF